MQRFRRRNPRRGRAAVWSVATASVVVAVFFLVPSTPVSPQEPVPIEIQRIAPGDSSPTLTELARTIDDTLRLSVDVLDELVLAGVRDSGAEPILVSGTVGRDDDGTYRIAITAVDPVNDREVARLSEAVSGLFQTFAAVDRITETLLSALSGREIRLGSIEFDLAGHLASGEMTVDGTTVQTFDEEYDGWKEETVRIDRIPAGEHDVVFVQPRGDARYRVERTVRIEPGEAARFELSIPAITASLRDEIATERYRDIVESVVAQNVWIAESGERSARHNMIATRGADPATRTLLRGWLFDGASYSQAWSRRRSRSLPSFTAVVDGDPREWVAISPLYTTTNVGRNGAPDGEGSEAEAIRLSAGGDTLFFLWTLNGPVNRRYSYRFYFTYDDATLPILMVALYPGENDGEVVLRNFDTEEYIHVPSARLSYRISQNFVEGRVLLPENTIDRIVGLDHAKIKYDARGDGFAVRYRAGRFLATGDDVGNREATTVATPERSGQLDFDALMDWVSAAR